VKFLRFAFFLLLSLGAGISNAVDLDTQFGRWTIREVYCRTCASVDKSDIGTTVGACRGVTAYRKMSDTKERRATIRQKLDPKWIAKNGRPELFSVTCDKMDFMLFVILPDSTLVYIDDGNVVYRLSRD
jgi:hypothetical protein